MDQKKIGGFLRELRNERGVTQERLAEMLGVTNRSVSRWETGATKPDFDLLIQIAEYFGVSADEILDGERKPESASPDGKDTLLKVADYSSSENIAFSKKLRIISCAGLFALSGYSLLQHIGGAGIFGYAADFLLGFTFGALICGALYTGKYMSKIRAFKLRLLGKIK